jgi:hypothetical protein
VPRFIEHHKRSEEAVVIATGMNLQDRRIYRFRAGMARAARSHPRHSGPAAGSESG